MLTIVIIGAGPGGQTAAAEFLRTTKHKVILIEKRKLSEENFIRSRRIATYGDTYNILAFDQKKITDKKHEKLLKEISPNEHTWDTHRTAKLKDIERALFRKTQLYPDNLTIFDQTEVSDVDVTQHKITLKTSAGEKTIDFNYLIIADGANQDTLKKINKKYADQKQNIFNIVSMNTGFDYCRHASIYLQQELPMVRRSQEPIHTVEQKAHTNLEKFKKLGWTKPYPPISFCLFDRSNKKVNVSTEIPESIYFEPNEIIRRKKLIEWAKLIIESQVDIDSENLYVKVTSKHPGKAALRCSIFTPPRELTKVDSYFKKTEKGGIVILGDAAMTSFYPTAMGLNFSIKLASTLVKCFDGDHFKAKEFSAAADECASQIETSCRSEMQTRASFRSKL